MDPIERSPSGQPVYRHQPRPADAPFEVAHGDPGTIEAVEAHVERYIGPIDWVWHEVISDRVHLDVHVVEPTPKRPFVTLVTTGMSDRPMVVPPDSGLPEYAELLICLPSDWPRSQHDLSDERNYWPIRWLKTLARLPHDYDTWLGPGHTVPNGDPAEPFADGVGFSAMLVTWPLLVEREAIELETKQGRRVALYSLLPLYADELELKLAQGTNALYDGFDRIGVTELVDPARPSVLTT
jgi:suppressor of fused protein SUFU